MSVTRGRRYTPRCANDDRSIRNLNGRINAFLFLASEFRAGYQAEPRVDTLMKRTSCHLIIAHIDTATLQRLRLPPPPSQPPIFLSLREYDESKLDSIQKWKIEFIAVLKNVLFSGHTINSYQIFSIIIFYAYRRWLSLPFGFVSLQLRIY